MSVTCAAPVPHVRKKLLVNRSIQGRLIGRTVFYWVLYHVVLWHAILVYQFVQHRSQMLSDPNLTAIPFGTFYESFVVDSTPMMVCALLLLPLFLFDLLRMTHRIAGPLVNFQNSLDKVMRGEPVGTIRIRSGDLLVEFQGVLNEFLEWHSRQMVDTESSKAGRIAAPEGMTDQQAQLVEDTLASGHVAARSESFVTAPAG